MTEDINGAAVKEPMGLVEDFEDVSPQTQKEQSVRNVDREKCTVPCEMTAKLMQDEKNSWCSNLQHSMTTYTRSTRKLIRDLIDEQQKTLEFLSNQVLELTNKVHSLSLDVQRSNSEMFSMKPMHAHGEHWLGLRKIHSIVSQKNTRFKLHISFVSQDDSMAFASYDNFWLEDESKFFAIHLGRYAGSAGDAFRGYEQEQNQDTAPFSTLDVDNDGCIPFCTFDGKAVESCSEQHNNTGWWFNQCGRANLNGSPLEQDRSTQPQIHWDTWTKNGVPVSIKSVTMKIRRIEGSNLK
ncbi:Angiopoietin-related protein 5 [Bagarius yarrelli]|uniref:Angiopoietin-related protein 5 n=1 Tax=Bagarius yarrelli TaxID=175774 RepID=A0A556UZC7_BAGYA|nr:Angiopoietin-related protein 5 [Bagarius yarrelli]